MSYLMSWFEDPRNTLIFFLLAFPGRILALSVHEYAHAWVANRCGDSTARDLGRMTLNPVKHLDPLGTIMMIFLGYGWAKPVPVNPRNYRNYRRDDLKVSLAGVTMNFLMFLVGSVALYAIIALTLLKIPVINLLDVADQEAFRIVQNGVQQIFILEGNQYYYATIADILAQAPFIGDWLIGGIYGSLAGYAYDMLGYFVLTNLVVAVFNLIPVPPLDGYHVLNDMVLRRSDLFARQRTVRVASGIMMVLVLTGVLGELLSWVDTGIIEGMGALAAQIFRLMGLV